MRRPLTNEEQALLLQRPHRTKLYMVVDRPEPVFTARVNNAAIARGAMVIAYNSGAGTRSKVAAGMTLLVGSAAGKGDRGTVRVRSAPTGDVTGSFVVAENSDVAWAHQAYLSILPDFRLWSVFPRVTYSGGTLSWYKDWDQSYSANNWLKQGVWLAPVPIMGPPAVAFLDGDDVTIKFFGGGRVDEWNDLSSHSWTYEATNQFRTLGNHTGTYARGKYLRFKQSGEVKYTAIIDSYYDSPATVVVISPSVLANSAVTEQAWGLPVDSSYTLCPNGIKVNNAEQGDVEVHPIGVWAFEGGTPSSGDFLRLQEFPYEVAWDTPGRYLASLQVKNSRPLTDGNRKRTTSYRPVFILNRPGTAEGVHEPYEHFELVSCDGDFGSGGWTAKIRVFGDADIDEFPDGAMIVLFAEEWYGDTPQSIGGYPYRENVKLVAWIVAESIRQGWAPDGRRYVEFQVQTIDGLMKEKEGFPLTVEDRPSLATGNPVANEWWQMHKLQVNRAAWYMLYWHTTLFQLTDVRILNDSSRVAAQDFPAGSLYRQVDDFAAAAVLGRLLSDRQSCLYLEKDIQTEPGEWRTLRKTVLALDKDVHLSEGLQLERRHQGRTRLVEVGGVGWTGYEAKAYIGYAPGSTPRQDGVDEMIKGIVVDANDTKGKAEVRQIAGYVLAQRNNPWPDVPVKLQGNHAYLDIAPQNWLAIDLEAQDSKRGVVWDAKKLIPRRVSMRYDPSLQLMQFEASLEAEAVGEAGVVGDYTPISPIPVPPRLPTTWRGLAYIGTEDGVYRVWPGNQYWECVTFRGEPFDDEAELFVYDMCFVRGENPTGLVIATNQGMFRGTYSGYTIVWEKWDLPDLPWVWHKIYPADLFTYTHVISDVADPTGLTFYFAAYYDSRPVNPEILCFLGKTTDGGESFEWLPLQGIEDDENDPQDPIIPVSIDIDKEDGSRIFVTGYRGNSPYDDFGLTVYDTDGNVLASDWTSFTAELHVYCPFKPSGSAVDGDYIILYGSGAWTDKVDVYSYLVYSTDQGASFEPLVTDPSFSPREVTFVDVLPRDIRAFTSFWWTLSPLMGSRYYCSVSANEVWYDGITTLGTKRLDGLSFSLKYHHVDVHKRDPDIILLLGKAHVPIGDEDFEPIPRVLLSVNRGASWTDFSAGLPTNVDCNCCLLDWGSVI